jgi:hypothetical protein
VRIVVFVQELNTLDEALEDDAVRQSRHS